MKSLILIMLISLLVVGSQIFLKNAVSEMIKFNYNSIIKLIFKKNFILFIIMSGSSVLAWIYIISYEKISYAYPLTSVSYIFMLIAGYYFFDEHISIYNIFGILFIILGIFFINFQKVQ